MNIVPFTISKIIVLFLVLALVASNVAWVYVAKSQNSDMESIQRVTLDKDLAVASLSAELQSLAHENEELRKVIKEREDQIATQEALLTAQEKAKPVEEKISEVVTNCEQFACASIENKNEREECVDKKVACYQGRLDKAVSLSSIMPSGDAEQKENLAMLLAQTKNDEEQYQRLLEEARKKVGNNNQQE